MARINGEWQRGRASKVMNDAVRLFVSLRRYLARNHPFLWQIRLHSLLFLSVALLVSCVGFACLIPITKYSVSDIELWHGALFLFSFLCVLYWMVSFFLLLDPSQMPPTIREPPLVVLILCSILLLLPSYGFLPVATHRLVQMFPDIANEEEARQVLQILATNAGDNRGKFTGGVGLPKDALLDEFPLPPSLLMPQSAYARYSIEPGGIVGPAAKAGVPTKQFRQALACAIGNATLRKVLTTNKFALGPANAGDTGKLTAGSPSAVAPQHRSGALSNLYPEYAAALKYEIRAGPEGDEKPYCLGLNDERCNVPSIIVSVDCASLSDQAIGRIFDGISQSLLRDYLPPMSADQAMRLSEAVFTPFCEVGKRVPDCNAAYVKLKDVIALLDSKRSEEQLRRIKAAFGSHEAVNDFKATISRPADADQVRDLTVVAGPPKTEGEPVTTLTMGWLLSWIFVLALLATSTKTFRLVRAASANYVFAALFFVPAVLFISYFGIALIGDRLAAVGRYFGWNELSISFDADTILLTYFAGTLVYIVWQVTKRRCSHAARIVASFNLFFLIVMSFYLPFLTFPVIGTLSEKSWVLVIAYAVYFGVLFDLCYALARRARERPA
ncbi:MAG: hypothetical protein ACREEK_17430 [Bradyrhizobium sp.]